ncbi:MAG: CHASE3 domain-containing protein [Pyrinomonadaceae bacterium]
MNWLQTVLKWRLIRGLQIWNRASIRAQGGIIALIPIAAVIVSFLFAIYGNNQRGWIQYDIQRRFKLVRQYNDLLLLMVDAETGERGYFLTKRVEFLEPYQKAVSDIPQTISALRSTINEELGEKQREERLESLAKIEDLISRQLTSFKVAQTFAEQNKNMDELYAHLQNGKILMDEIRANLNQMETRDGELLSDRIEDINSIRRRDYILLFIALCVGLLARLVSFYLFDRGIVRRVNRLRKNVEELNAGEKIKNPPPKKDDAVGLLEQEIVKIAGQKDLLNNSDK